MFGRKPRFPVETSEKVQIEGSLDWLLAALGFAQTPDVNHLTRKSPSLQSLVGRRGPDFGEVFEFVKLQFPFDTSGCHLVILEGERPGIDVRSNDSNAIYVSADESVDLDLLIAEIACQFSRRYLIDLVDEEESDWISVGGDYLPVLYGLGVFCANSSLLSNQVTVGEEQFWSFWKLRNIPARYYGVAMACLAYRSDTHETQWQRALRPDAKTPFQKSLNYYEKTGDCLMFAAPSQRVFRNDDSNRLISLLDGATASAVIGVLDELQLNFEKPGRSDRSDQLLQLSGTMHMFLEHRDRCVRHRAARFCLLLDSIDDRTVESLKMLLADSDSTIREAALQTLVKLAIPGRLTLSDLRSSLSDYDLNVADWGAMGVMQLGHQDERVVYDILPTIRRATNAGEWETAVHLCEALETLSDKWNDKLEEFFADSPDQLYLLRQGLQEWKQQI